MCLFYFISLYQHQLFQLGADNGRSIEAMLATAVLSSLSLVIGLRSLKEPINSFWDQRINAMSRIGFIRCSSYCTWSSFTSHSFTSPGWRITNRSDKTLLVQKLWSDDIISDFTTKIKGCIFNRGVSCTNLFHLSDIPRSSVCMLASPTVRYAV